MHMCYWAIVLPKISARGFAASRCVFRATLDPAMRSQTDHEADRGRAYSAGEADAERAGGELSRAVARRVFERELVSESVRCQAQDRSLEDGIQRRTSPQQLGLSDANRICDAGNNELWKRCLPKNGKL